MPRRTYRPSVGGKCPDWLRKLVFEWAGHQCEGRLLLDADGRVLIPYMPMDTEPVPLGFAGFPHLWVPTWGLIAPCASVRYPEVCNLWTCQRSLAGCGEVDRFRPGAQGGEYSYMNTGALCDDCNLFKGQKWPWFDYRSEVFKRNREEYLRKGNGGQLWLFPF